MFYDRIKAFEALLEAFSTAEPVVALGHSSFSAGNILDSVESTKEFIDDSDANPFRPYFERILDDILIPPRYFGISIIGSEQVLPGLTLGKLLKQRFPDVPVLIGGSVFSRLVEKTSVCDQFFGKCFDIVCRYEGERPLAALLAAGNPRSAELPNIAFKDDTGKVILTDLIDPVDVNDCPTPDFSGLPLQSYYTPELVLPLLSTRGCYWGKCAFCYHGMIYQDRYRMRDPDLIAADLASLHSRFAARHFAFNDEALPPKLFRLLPASIPHDKYFFTGLYKFEKIFRQEHYDGMYAAGFRSLYIGLESASERVQKHMKKNNKKATMIDNLRFAHEAGIWNHTFNFFGFPTETMEEAEETIDFLLDHSDIIHSEGTGTFSFEHNAPISQTPALFGVTKVKEVGGDFTLYMEYEVASGLDAGGAEKVLEKFQRLRDEAGLYKTGNWIPREYLLLLLGRHERDRLRAMSLNLEITSPLSSAKESLTCLDLVTPSGRKFFVVNRKASIVSEANEDAISIIKMLKSSASISALIALVPAFKDTFPLIQDGEERPGFPDTLNDPLQERQGSSSGRIAVLSAPRP